MTKNPVKRNMDKFHKPVTMPNKKKEQKKACSNYKLGSLAPYI